VPVGADAGADGPAEQSASPSGGTTPTVDTLHLRAIDHYAAVLADNGRKLGGEFLDPFAFEVDHTTHGPAPRME
jgi:hypothetical protein